MGSVPVQPREDAQTPIPRGPAPALTWQALPEVTWAMGARQSGLRKPDGFFFSLLIKHSLFMSSQLQTAVYFAS